MSRQDSHRLPPLSLGFCFEKIRKTLYLGQVHPIVFESATREFTRFS